jgi:hypothetical protein
MQIKLIFSALLIFLSCSFSALAAEDDKFKVNNIYVDEIGKDADEARQTAISKAQRKAFDILLYRLESQDLKYSDKEVTKLVSGIEFDKERFSERRYRANLNISFNPEYTLFLLKKKEAKNTGDTEKPKDKYSFLIIPLFTENGTNILWQPENIWLDMWREYSTNANVEIKTPLGDLEDITLLNMENIGSLPAEKIEFLQAKYKADKVIIAQIIYDYQTIADEVSFELMIRQINDWNNVFVAQQITADKKDDIYQHLVALAKQTVFVLDGGVLEYAQQQPASKKEFLIALPNLSEWVKVKQRLSTIEQAKNFKIKSISARYAHIVVDSEDDGSTLIDALKAANFKVSLFGKILTLTPPL